MPTPSPEDLHHPPIGSHCSPGGFDGDRRRPPRGLRLGGEDDGQASASEQLSPLKPMGLVPRRHQSGVGRLHRRPLEMRDGQGANPSVRGRQYHADPLQGPATQTQGLGLRDRQAINDAQSASCSGSPPGDHHARDAARRDGVRVGLSPCKSTRYRRPNPAPMRSDAPGTCVCAAIGKRASPAASAMIERFMVAPWTACSKRSEAMAAESSASDPSR